MMSMGEEPGMSQAVRVRTSSQIGAVGRCPECIRAAMCVSVGVCRGGGEKSQPGDGALDRTRGWVRFVRVLGLAEGAA